MNGMKYIIKKELTRVFSDKKLVISLFVLPVVLMVGMYYFIGQMQSSMMDDIEEHVSSVYIQNAPEGFDGVISLAKFDANLQYIEKDDDVTAIRDDILKGDTDLLVVFEDDFLNKIASYKTNDVIPEVKTFYNNSEEYSSAARNNFVNQVLGFYQQQLLTERFGDLNQLTVFQIDVDPEASIIVDNEKATGKLFGTLLPYLITFMLFIGAMSLGVDAITGEKERGTMASMLLTPLKRKEIVLGKLLSLSILSCMSAAIYAVVMIGSMPIMLKSLSGDALDGLSLTFSVLQIVELLAIMLTLVYLYVAIVSLAAVLAKTAKEANSYVSPIYIVVLAVGMITMFTGNGEQSFGMYAIPVYGSAISIQKILVGELTMAQFGATVGGTVLLSVLITVLITKAFNSEKVMFNA
jgi:sodium transport system permease protein